MKRQIFGQTCCTTTPSAMGFWAAVFLLVYGGGLWLGSLWPALRQYGDTLILAAMGVACFTNFARHRTLHCGLSGPIFIAGALVAALTEARIWAVDLRSVWVVVLVGVAIAFLIEWRTVGGRDRASTV
jgi:membrane-bound metal-dependent hydrolase YbcI (DUF457 family)